MVLSLPRTMPPIDEPIRSSPIGPRLAAAMAKLAETMAKYYPDSTSYTPPPPNESMDTLADAMAKLEIASKRLATSTAHLISITAKTTTLNYTATRTESKDDTINNTHRPTTIDGEATTCKNDTTVVTQTPKIEKVTTQNKINKPDNTMVRFLSDSSVENEISQIPFSPVFGLQANPTNKTPKLRHSPSTAQPTHKKPKVPHEIAILSRHSPLTRVAASNTIAAIHVLDMLTNPPKQTEALPLHRLSLKEIQIIRSHGLCFHCPETFHLHRMCPPKFV
ncbi:hypothetical protein Tco_1226210 [Tanacetum coccineum]